MRNLWRLTAPRPGGGLKLASFLLMTTTISLPTLDGIVIGCDSMATSSKPIIDPYRLLVPFFDADGKLKLDSEGKPLLDDAKKLTGYTQQIPVNQLPNVTKIFSLAPFKAGLLFAGIASVNRKSVRNLVESFLFQTPASPESYTIKELADALADFFEVEFEQGYDGIPKENRPLMEVLISGYSSKSWLPEVFRITCGPKKEIRQESKPGEYEIAFGGQHDVIQRVVNGIDLQSYFNLIERSTSILYDYHQEVEDRLKAAGVSIDLPPPDFAEKKYQLFAQNFGGVNGILSDTGGLSEQAAINFVDFLINTMINAQEFSDRIPTVGGQVHIALITIANGFKWISKEEYHFRDHSVPKYEG